MCRDVIVANTVMRTVLPCVITYEACADKVCLSEYWTVDWCCKVKEVL